MAGLVVWLVRALAFTIYTVDGDGLSPTFRKGDRVLINRWSYGLRTGGEGSLFPYARLVAQPVERGDVVAFNLDFPPLKGVFICRCVAVPGDTVNIPSQTVVKPSGDTVMSNATTLVVPGLVTCANENYYWLEPLAASSPYRNDIGENTANHVGSAMLGFVPESRIIGRVMMVVYNHNDSLGVFRGYDRRRWLLSPGL